MNYPHCSYIRVGIAEKSVTEEAWCITLIIGCKRERREAEKDVNI